jgi:SAM-dependent methyltransferase
MCLDLGRQQPANLLTQSKDESVKEYPLGLVRCRACGHGQLLHMVSPDLLFNRYLYKSGTSGTLRAYFQWFFEQTSTLLPGNGRVLEIAANDGSLLTKFTEAGFESIGIDPAANIVEAGEWGPLRMVCDFFPSETIAGEEFELVLGLNVLAHTPDPLGLLRAVSEQLTEDGIAIFQTSQATMLTHGEFDTIYHEHYSFFTPQSLTILAERAGLCVRRIDLTDIHGTSFAFVLSTNPDASLPDGLFRSGKFAIETARSKTILETFEGDVNELYEAFVDTAVERMVEVRELVAAKKASGHAVVMVGVAAKAITFARAAGLELDRAFDEAPEKIGLFIPGLGLQIKDLEEVKELRGQTLFVLTAWNFASELERKVRAQATQCEPEFLTYFPEVRAW